MSLWAEVRRRAEQALASGAMHSFECALEHVEDAGVSFVIRRATKYPAGETAAGRTKAAPALPRNPFLPPEPALLVADLGATHRVLLNKFSVLREHILLVTREYVDQMILLDERDFAVVGECMQGAAVLAFYNGGPAAGGSQPHKHLQLVTLPLSPRAAIPLGTIIERAHEVLPFRHALAVLESGDIAQPAVLARKYHALLDSAGLHPATRAGVEWERHPYNLVLCADWMLVVPRGRDRFEGISINALAFAGSFFVRDRRGLEAIAAAGPMKVLAGVALGLGTPT